MNKTNQRNEPTKRTNETNKQKERTKGTNKRNEQTKLYIEAACCLKIQADHLRTKSCFTLLSILTNFSQSFQWGNLLHCPKVGSLRMCMKVSNKLDISGLSGLLVCVKNKLTTKGRVKKNKWNFPLSV